MSSVNDIKQQGVGYTELNRIKSFAGSELNRFLFWQIACHYCLHTHFHVLALSALRYNLLSIPRLPRDIQTAPTISTFKNLLKTHLFSLSYNC